MKDNYLLLHGSFASPFSNWIPWLQNEITNNGGETILTPQCLQELDYKIMIIGLNF